MATKTCGKRMKYMGKRIPKQDASVGNRKERVKKAQHMEHVKKMAIRQITCIGAQNVANTVVSGYKRMR